MNESRGKERLSGRSITWRLSRPAIAGRPASRAISTRSAARSTTFLTGVAAYPGGDITDKLTRHAKSPVPDVLDLRLDVPPVVGAIIKRMMAKRPEDRFASYDELIAALEAAPVAGLDQSPAIALIPLADEVADNPAEPANDPWPSRESGEYASDGAASGPIQVSSLAELAAGLSGDLDERPPARSPVPEPPKPLLRRGPVEIDDPEPEPTSVAELPSIAPSQGSSSASVWIIAGAFLGFAVILLVIGLVQFMDSTPLAQRVDRARSRC